MQFLLVPLRIRIYWILSKISWITKDISLHRIKACKITRKRSALYDASRSASFVLQKAYHANCVSILMRHNIGNLAVYPNHEKDKHYCYVNPEE